VLVRVQPGPFDLFNYTKGNEAMARDELRRIKLTEDQYIRLSTIISLRETDIIKLAWELIERAQFEANKAWNEIRHLANAVEGEAMSLNHITQEIVVYSEAEDFNKDGSAAVWLRPPGEGGV
jgi:hypothetical protein